MAGSFPVCVFLSVCFTALIVCLESLLKAK